MSKLAVRPVLEMTPNKLMLDGLLRIAEVLLSHNMGQVRGDYWDWKEIMRYTDLHPMTVLSGPPC